MNQIAEIYQLRNLTKLEYLSLFYNNIKNIYHLQFLTNLEMLDLEINQINDISALQNLINLKRLYLSDNQIGYISGLQNLTNLNKLWLNTNSLDNTDLIFLYDLDHLEDLDLRFNSGINSGTAMQTLGDNLNYLTCEQIQWDGTCPNNPTEVPTLRDGIPQDFYLGQNYPNPFNPKTTISFRLPVDAQISIQVFDVQGRLIADLFTGKKSAGNHQIIWQAAEQSSGMYFIQMRTDQAVWMRKCVLIK